MNTKTKSAFHGVKVTQEFSMQAFHMEMQALRQQGKDVSLKQYLGEIYGPEYSPEKFYRDAGIDLKGMTVEKMLSTDQLSRWLFPEVFRDAIRRGLEYTPFYPNLVTGEENINSTGITMPSMDLTTVDANTFRLRDVAEGSTIPEAEVVTWSEKQVTIRKKGRGLKQTYESIMFTPIDLAAIYFEELGSRLGSDLDGDLVNVALNGDQADNSQSAPVIGATNAGTLAYIDIARAWVRLRRIGRSSSVMLMSEADALTVLNMTQFQQSFPANGASPSGVTLNVNTPLPTSQDIFVHERMTTGKILMVDTRRAFVQLTAMPLLVESERIVNRQLNGEYVSIITGFANIFRDGRLVLDYTTTLGANPGPTVLY